MVATVTLRRWTGASGSPTKTDVSSSTTLFVTEDAQYAADNANPITIPVVDGTLQATMTNVTTSCSVTVTNGATSFSSAFVILVDSELMKVTAISGAGPYTYTVTRGVGGTTAAAHNSLGVNINHVNLSYWVAFRLSADTTPVGTINNIKAYSDGANSQPAGTNLFGNTATAYTQASGTTGTSGILLDTTNYATVTAPVDFFTFTSGSPKSVSGSISNPNTGDVGDLFVLQYAAAASVAATTGDTTTEVLTFYYDET